ncbi:MAG: EamA family transporter [Lachnospiraceae bacterium]|nr:EamA family transporter [Lachnospiraceae bacterium]
MKYVLLFLFSVFISSVSQIILKSSANDLHKSTLQDYLNGKVILAYGVFFLSSLLTVFAYRYVPLSMGPILESSGYIFVAVLGYVFLKEKIEKRKLLGLGIILIGIVIANI